MAVATPCWPAPVSAITRGLPIRLARSAWPRALLILWAPVWRRSSRFRYTVRAQVLGEAARRGRAASGGRRSRAESAELGAEGLVGARLEPRPLELVEGGDQRLGHEAPAVGAEVGAPGPWPGGLLAHEVAPPQPGRSCRGGPSASAPRRRCRRAEAASTARKNAVTRAGSSRPSRLGAAGRVHRVRPPGAIPSPTLSGVQPARQHKRDGAGCVPTTSQSRVSPLPRGGPTARRAGGGRRARPSARARSRRP